MPATKLREFLDAHNVNYTTLSHLIAYTAQETAAHAHIPGQELAKTVILKVDDSFAMAVLPASQHVDLNVLKSFTGKTVRLTSEVEFADRFPDCEAGAMPPFGNLYGMPVFVEESLAADKEIAFNAGTHTELMRLAYADFVRLVQPVVLKFAAKRAHAARASWQGDRLW